MSALSGLQSYAEGGLFRRRSALRREVVTDQEALRFYLGRDEPARGPLLDDAMLDDSRMDSMPILSRHTLPAAVSAQP
jgi:hypothetical protein